jgi:hypothetical protein
MKNFPCIAAIILSFGIGAVYAQTNNIPGSLTIGSSNTVGIHCLAVGESNTAVGTSSVAMGSGSYANASSLAVGLGARATGSDSVALNASTCGGAVGFSANCASVQYLGAGFAPSANAAAAFNIGGSYADATFAANNGGAYNIYSAAFGFETQTASPAQFVVGRYNRTVGTNEDWTGGFDGSGNSSSNNALFIVGNGNSGTPSNAMQVRKDGLVLINASGDVDMGEFTNGPTP